MPREDEFAEHGRGLAAGEIGDGAGGGTELVPGVARLREAVAGNWRPMRRDSVAVCKPAVAPARLPAVEASARDLPHGYREHVFSCAGDGWLSALANINCANAEVHGAAAVASPGALLSLLAAAKEHLAAAGARYVEARLPASCPRAQQAALSAGLWPCAYLPAWQRAPGGGGGKHVDAVVFAWARDWPDPCSLPLTDKARVVAGVALAPGRRDHRRGCTGQGETTAKAGATA